MKFLFLCFALALFVAPVTVFANDVQQVKITAVGDLMVHIEQYEDALKRGGEVCDFSHNFSQIEMYFRDSDIVIGNFETTLAGKDVGFKDYPRFSVPDEFATALKNAGFNLLTTANNHSMDSGAEALLRTSKVLRGLGIGQIGTYASQAERDEIKIIEKGGISFAFLAYTFSTNQIHPPKPYMVNMLCEDLYKGDIARAREQQGADFVIVLAHLGNEYETYPSPQHINTVMAMFEAGADIILCSHPHVVAPAKYVDITNNDGSTRRGFVVYSLGNFISGQREWARDAGAVFNFYFEKAGDAPPVLADVSFIPTWVRFHKNGEFDIAVLSVYDVLRTEFWGGETGLSKSDLERVRTVQRETTKIITGTSIPEDNIEVEYPVPRPSPASLY